MTAFDKTKTRIRFLIMEQLPVDGRYVSKADLEQNVSIDARSLSLCYSTNLFEIYSTTLLKINTWSIWRAR